MKLSRNTSFFQCGSQGIDPVAIRMFKHRVFEEILSCLKILDFSLHISTKIAPKIVKIVSCGPLHMSKYAEFRGEFDGDDENSSKLFRITVFDEILFEKKVEKSTFQGYIPLSLIPLGGPMVCSRTRASRALNA